MLQAEQQATIDFSANEKPSTFKIIVRELIHDKPALISIIFLAVFLVIIYGSTFVINQNTATYVDLASLQSPPGPVHWLGTDSDGRDVFAQLILGARNSFTIGFMITLISALIGLTTGLLAGYYGGIADNLIMRTVDFVYILPMLMMIIVFVSIVANYTIASFILIMSAFLWIGKARLIRAKTLAEREKDYVSASRLAGTPGWQIILFQILPNLSSIIIVNLTLTLAGNIGIETGLSYLGFGLPTGTPSLGTLVSNANDPDIIQNYWWMWLPACLTILVLMLCINFVGQALKRAANASQRV